MSVAGNYASIAYEGISWTIGSTSFRTKELNKKIEWQLNLLDQFWSRTENQNKVWSGNESLQQLYYKHLWENDFIEGNAPRPAKDAREKTSGLCDIGLVDRKTRRLTEVGKELLDIAKSNNFKSDNLLQIEADSYIYLKQLIKTSVDLGNSIVRPFIILARVLNEVEYLSHDEFTYLLPLIFDEKSFKTVITKIKEVRKGLCDINQTIYEVMLSHNSYKNALELLTAEKTVSKDLIVTILMNRKSAQYSKPFYELYHSLYKVLVSKDFSEKAMKFLEKAISDCRTTRSSIKKMLFSSTKDIAKNGEKSFLPEALKAGANEHLFKEFFFKICHIAKALNNLEDYGDLNLRYFTMSDCFITKDKTVQFSTLPKVYFEMVAPLLKSLCFVDCKILCKSVEMKGIDRGFVINSEDFYKKIADIIGAKVYDRTTIQSLLDKERYDRFNRLLEEKFTDAKLLQILDNFKNRKTSNDMYDEEIKKVVSSNSDGPTSFEYILAIIWYKISDYQGDILTYMNLSLDADLLPKTHAGGGEADIVYKYTASSDYPAHDLLIEATLTDSTSQRRMEMEPVSRHLGEYLCKNKYSNAYCLFLTNYLHINVISDFRMRKAYPYYGNNGEKIFGMHIIPMETALLEVILKKGLKYKQLYPFFWNHFESGLEPREWYGELEKEVAHFSVEKFTGNDILSL